ncbi:sigma-54-dependent transcriptional regulator [Galenea microaerophila]
MQKPKILIIDDEKDIRSLMEEIFNEEGYEIHTAANGAQGIKLWEKVLPNLVFLDVWMPDMDGVTLLKQMKVQAGTQQSEVIMMSGHGTIETAIEATRHGAYDFLEKPLSLAKLLVTAERALEHQQLHEENSQLKQKAPPQFLPIGHSKAMQSLRETIQRVAQYRMPLYIYGEHGVGKHHLAEAIHLSGHASTHRLRFISAEDLNALSESANLESSLLERVTNLNQGTLVISEIETLRPEIQKALEPLLFAAEQPLDVRLIALSHQPIDAFNQNPGIRSEWQKRLSVMPIHIPPLRTHTEDIPELINHFVDYFVTKEGLNYRAFDLSAQNRMRQYAWPGNLREMQNVIQRLLILGDQEAITEAEVIPLLAPEMPDLGVVDTSVTLKKGREQFECAYLLQLLRETGGNITETAKRSGMDRTNLYRKFKSLNIDPKNLQ